ncbi:hypothetical protein A1353_00450 [Methylomonas methanica]|uniref:Uncharacterized protein n=1 Tax=Methylomonas methanica TaxID=421 RepID=A0A177M8P6_METMH|nr:hypothetical protein [Methylomonas methanica]OAI01725.1 hypothetical protein A1353_00450 [Methylomonas methanica]
MSLNNTIFVKFKLNEIECEGEFIHWLDTNYFHGDNPGISIDISNGYIRPFDRYLRQTLIDRNMSIRKIDFIDWMNLGEVISCDAFRSNEVNHLRIIEKDEIKTSLSEINLCKKDIIHRRLALNIKDEDDLNLTQRLTELFNSI